MYSIKMKVTGMYNGQLFTKGDVLTLSEDAFKGLDARDYDLLETPKQAEAREKAEAKAKAKAEADAKETAEEAKKESNGKTGPDADKMQGPVETK